MSLAHFHDTIAAIATAEGRSALAIIRISGTDAISIVSKIVSDPEALLVARGGSSIYAWVRGTGYLVLRGNEDREPLLDDQRTPTNYFDKPSPPILYPISDTQNPKSGTIDDVIIHVFRAPRSYTGEDLCEITAHGSPVISREIIDLLVANGARLAEPGEFSRRAFYNGKIGIEQAELISIKANAQSEQELWGAELALSEKFGRLRDAYDALISLIARIDAEIDFGESDQVEIADFEESVEKVLSFLHTLVRDSETRRENAGYFTVALTGPPNVGKSSIFNALLNFERSIVSDIPGTTRDYVEAFIAIDGFRVKIIDTAGLRTLDNNSSSSEESLEARGIELGAGAARHADITLRVTDPSDRYPALTKGSILLHNKIDLDGWNESLCVSALSGEGFDTLHAWLSSELQKLSSDLSLIRLSDSESNKITSVIKLLHEIGINSEALIIAEELRNAVSVISGLLGNNLNEDSLNYIFSKMCIGK